MYIEAEGTLIMVNKSSNQLLSHPSTISTIFVSRSSEHHIVNVQTRTLNSSC
jgi:hypothetical protein